MHESSFAHMRRLILRLDRNASLRILDIGSYDVNGSYRTLLDAPNWTYTGVDLEAGPGVDVVLKSAYHLPFASGSIDLVVSGQAFEHVEFFWMTWLEMMRVLKPGGMVFLIAPSRGPEHRYPQDCWRFYPDGFRALAKFGNCELIEVSTDWEPHPDPGSADWGDTVGVFLTRSVSIRQRFASFLIYLAMRIKSRPA